MTTDYDNVIAQTKYPCEIVLYSFYINYHYSMDCTHKWIGTVQNISSSTVRSRDKIVRVSYSSVLSPKVDESTIQLPSLLLVVGAVSLPLKCEYFL